LLVRNLNIQSIIADDRDRRKGNHLLLEGEFTSSSKPYFKLMSFCITSLIK
jgi:hypothetical protein